jgi:nucleoside-diphosphate-sugar epimerase
MSRVLLTGAAGLVGRWAVEALCARGHEVHAVSRTARPDEARGVRWHDADLLDGAAVARLTADVRAERLLHLAWLTEHGRYLQAPENGDWLEASTELVRRFAEWGGARVVGAGTCAEYDWDLGELATNDCDERTTPLKPRTAYGRSKHALAEWLASRAQPSWAWGRLFFLYGEGEDPRRLVPSVTRALLAGQPARVGPGWLVRDFLYTADAGAAFAALVDADVEGPVNVASGRALTIADLVTTLAALVGRPEALHLGALPHRPGDPPRLVGAVSRLRDEVGFAPSVKLEAGLSRVVEWWRTYMSRDATEPEASHDRALGGPPTGGPRA